MFLVYEISNNTWTLYKDIDDAENHIRACLTDKLTVKCKLYRWYDAVVLDLIEGWDEDMIAWNGDEQDIRIYTTFEIATSCLPSDETVLLFVEVPLKYEVTIVDRNELDDYC